MELAKFIDNNILRGIIHDSFSNQIFEIDQVKQL